ncbi:MAG TPA: c-type cytochrome [Solirubrobacteraceae bacterium]|nr:c-type cytochrome [Solirubrobacteraceae bacterium]
MRPVTATAAVLATVALALVLVACGSSPAPVATPQGSALFKHNCSGCHSLTGHQSARDQGGDLLAARLPHAVALQYAREMPVRRPLTHAQLEAIVDYIAAVQRR